MILAEFHLQAVSAPQTELAVQVVNCACAGTETFSQDLFSTNEKKRAGDPD